jgi:hypothetical protein
MSGFSLSCAPIQTAMCSMLMGFLDQGLNFLDKVQRLLNPKLDDIKLNLGKIHIDLPKLNGIVIDIGNFELPTFSTDCLSMLATMIENCPYLNEHSLLNDVASLTNTLDKYLKLDLNNYLNDLFPPIVIPGLPTELDIALDINFAFNICIDLKLDELVPGMDKLMSCLKAFCPGSDMSSRIDRLNSSLSNMSLSASGGLNVTGLLEAGGATPEEAAAFNNCNNSLVATQAAITSAVVAGAELARNTVIPTTGDKFLTTDLDCNCRISSLLSVQIIDCSASILIETSTIGHLSPCAICETSMSGILGIEMEFSSYLMYINSYVSNAELTVIEAGPIALTTDTLIISNVIGSLNVV